MCTCAKALMHTMTLLIYILIYSSVHYIGECTALMHYLISLHLIVCPMTFSLAFCMTLCNNLFQVVTSSFGNVNKFSETPCIMQPMTLAHLTLLCVLLKYLYPGKVSKRCMSLFHYAIDPDYAYLGMPGAYSVYSVIIIFMSVYVYMACK